MNQKMTDKITLQDFAITHLAQIKDFYFKSPSLMLEHYEHEMTTTVEYEGRELLELLQNADDAALKAKLPKALIYLSGSKLIIANTGHPFSQGGLDSIFHSNLSPKFNKKNQIGNKGLGFRTTLSWSDKVTILSGDLSVSFSKSNSKTILEDLIRRNPLIEKQIEKRYEKMQDAIAVFRCPEIIDSIELPEECSGYDTVIILDLKEKVLLNGQWINTVKVVEQQLEKSIDADVLLFLNNLNEIIIKTPNIEQTLTRKLISEATQNNGSVLKRWEINKNELSSQWNIYSQTGTNKPENAPQKSYELAIAWQDELTESKNVLHSFFRTDVTFRFPGILHGTFELSSNRNELIKGQGYNSFLFTKAAQLIAEVSHVIAQKQSGNITYHPLKISNVDFSSLGTLIKETGFEATLMDSIKKYCVFPAVSNQYIPWNDKDKPVFYPEKLFSEYLSPEQYKDLLLHSDDEFITSLLQKLEYTTYSLEHIMVSISKQKNEISTRDYALLINSIANYFTQKTDLFKTDGLFYDSATNLLSFKAPVFLPNQGIKYNLPKELGIQIISSDLAEELLKAYHCSDFKNLALALANYKIKEFNFSEVVEALIKYYTQKKEILIDDIKKLHQTLFNIYLLDQTKESFWNGTPINLINKKNKPEKAGNLYFGKEYGNTLTEEIYSYDSSKIVASFPKFDIDHSLNNNWQKYLEWLGVAYTPRKKSAKAEEQYAEYIMKNYNYRNYVDDYNFSGYAHFKQTLTGGYKTIDVLSIDDFDNILQNNSSESIISWIDRDTEIYNSIEKNKEPESSFIEFDFYNTRYYRVIRGAKMTSYIKWKLAHSNWLKTEAGIKAEPSKCSSAAYINEDFTGLIEKPQIDYDRLKLKQIQREKADYILSLVGVHKVISTLTAEMVYDMFLQLPEIDPSGKKSKTIYNQIAVNYDEKSILKINSLDRDHKNFMASGKVFCKDGNYHPISEVYYVNDRRYGETLLRQFNTIEIDRRRGKEKISKIFGVRPLGNIDLNIVGQPAVHDLNSKFELEIENFKPYVYVLRKEQDSGNEKNIIKTTKFQLVTNLKASLAKSGQQKSFELNHYEYLYLKNRNIIFISIPKDFTQISDLKDDFYFCSAIAEVFSAILNVDAQRLQIRELFSKSASVRDELLRSEMEDDKLEKLNDAKRKLGIISNPKIDFWKAFLKCFKGKKINLSSDNDEAVKIVLLKNFPENSEIIQTSFDRINYQDFNEAVSSQQIIELFKNTGITINEFNKFHYPSVNIALLYEMKFKKAVNDNLEDFKSLLYNHSKGNSVDKAKFTQRCSAYLTLLPGHYNEIDFDELDDLKNTVKESFNIDLNTQSQTINWSTLHAHNTEKIWSLVSTPQLDKKLFDQFLRENPSVDSLLFFDDEFAQIEISFKNWLSKNTDGNTSSNGATSKSNRIIFDNKPLFYNDLSDLKTQIDDLVSDQDIKKIDFKNIKITKKENSGPGKSSPSGSSRGLPVKKQKEEIGFLGEYIVYKHLLAITEKKSDVKWVSKYAKDCGVNLDGMDGLGYDIEYVPKGATYPRFVEVKAIGWEDAFHITSNEVKIGEKHKNNYEVFLVRNMENISETKIEKIQGLFDYKGKSFTDNALFTVVNDNFILKFKKS